MNVLACSFLTFDAVIGETPPDAPLNKQCQELKSSLHQRIDNVTDIYDDLVSQYADQIEPKVAGMDVGELAQFLTFYTKHVQCLLHFISAYHQDDWETYLAALDDQIRFFYAHALFHYVRLMPVHLDQMNQLENDDTITWKALKERYFCVISIIRPSLHCLQIKLLSIARSWKVLVILWALHKMRSHLIVLSSHCHTSPLLSKIGCVDSPASQLPPTLQVSIAVRSTRKAPKLRDSIQLTCEGNPFIVGTPLKSIVSSVQIPEAAKEDIFRRDGNGLDGYQTCVKELLYLMHPCLCGAQ